MNNPKIRIKSFIKPLKLFTRRSKPNKKSALALGDRQRENQLETTLEDASLAESSAPNPVELLQNLPNELLEHICFQLHPLDVVKCRILFRRLKELIDGSVELQFRIDLAIDGYLLSYRGNQPTKDVRAFHEKRRNALESLKCVASWEEAFSTGDFGQYAAHDGVFAQSLRDISTGIAFKTLIYKEMVPPQFGKKGWAQTWEDLGLLAIDFSFWVQGDLQILVESRDNEECRRIHFRTISTNEPHPNSVAPYVDILKGDHPIWTHCYTSCCEDRVAVMFFEGEWGTRRGAGLVIDCTEAKVIMPYTIVKDLEYLSRDEVLLLLHDEEDDVTSVTSIAVYSFPLQQIVCTCRFPFPKAPSSAQYATRTDARILDNHPVPLRRSFFADPEINIVVVDFKFLRLSSMLCVISIQRFRQMYTSLLEEHPGRRDFQWEEWGPTVTRWFPASIKTTGGDTVCGCRIIAWGDPSILHPQSRWSPSIMLLDFNPRPIRRGAVTSVDGECHEVVIDQETILEDVHADVVIKSSLPYRAFATSWLTNAAVYRFDGTTVIERGRDGWHFHSFLPLETHRNHDVSACAV